MSTGWQTCERPRKEQKGAEQFPKITQSCEYSYSQQLLGSKETQQQSGRSATTFHKRPRATILLLKLCAYTALIILKNV